ncbi:MAG: glycosyltransferase family 39 protein [Bryobacteraceae bacterium]
MPSAFLRRAAPLAAVAALLFFYLFQLNGVGVLSADEPRYAAIGRAMADSGDWITPRLWGKPWFEKSALLYWMVAAGTKLGIPGEAAARAPVAIASVAFLIWLWRWVRRTFGQTEAWCTCLVLSTSAGWIAYSYAALTDLPMTVALMAAFLLVTPPEQSRHSAWWAGAWLGVAVLAKGLVPIVLFLPAMWFARRHWLAILVGCTLVAAPWYLACYSANGQVFLTEFIWKHHILRFFSDSLQHVQPFWYYVPVLLAGFFPWTPVLLTIRRNLLEDERLRTIAIFVAFGLVFFSISRNKLPGYVLPLMPGIAILAGVAIARAKRVSLALASSGALLLLLPVIGSTLPEALRSGLSRSRPDWLAAVGAPLLVVLVVVLSTWRLAYLGRLILSTALVAVSVAAGVSKLKVEILPVLDERVSVRGEFRKLGRPATQVCAGDLHRARLYGFEYYFNAAIPECEDDPRSVVLSDERR